MTLWIPIGHVKQAELRPESLSICRGLHLQVLYLQSDQVQVAHLDKDLFTQKYFECLH